MINEILIRLVSSKQIRVSEEPLVSVVIPTYDRPDLLSGAIQSAVGQTYEHIELIIVDDCSPEPLQETVAYSIPSDIQLSFLRYDHNQGHAVARNTEMEAAEGEFIAFLDDEVAKDEDRRTNTAISRDFGKCRRRVYWDQTNE